MATIFSAVCSNSFSQGVGIGTAVPDPSAALDITNSSKGLLIPRMNTAAIAAIINPGNGLLVYDTQTNQLKVNTGTPSAPNFQPVAAGGNNNGWNLTGNNGTNAVTQFIGTADNQPLRFRINNSQAGELHPVTGNVFWGLRAGTASTTGFSNIAIGTDALKANTVRTNLVAIGDSALFNNGLGNTTPDQATLNTALGSKSLFANTTGSSNTATGSAALNANTSGSENTATGVFSLVRNTTGNNNTASGSQALFSNTSGSNNTALGFGSLAFNSTSSFNTAVGSLSLRFNTTGVNNTAVGHEALTANTTGFGNTAIGFSALNVSSLADFNTAVGENSLQFNTTGGDNVGLGDHTLLSNTTGSQNTAIGSSAGSFSTNGSFNVFVGTSADVVASNIDNCVAIGRTAKCTASNQVRLGNSATSSIGGVVGFSNISDGRYKKNIQDGVKGLDFIMKLQPVTYQLDINGINKQLGVAITNPQEKQAAAQNASTVFSGFIAQDVEQAAKTINYDFSGVDKPKNAGDMYGLRYAEFVVPLVKAIQEQQQVINELKRQQVDLLKRITALEKN
jgi:hypothetical protein